MTAMAAVICVLPSQSLVPQPQPHRHARNDACNCRHQGALLSCLPMTKTSAHNVLGRCLMPKTPALKEMRAPSLHYLNLYDLPHILAA